MHRRHISNGTSVVWPVIETRQIAFGSDNEADAWTAFALQRTCGDKRRLLRRGDADGSKKQEGCDGSYGGNARHQENSG
jgi:hypothetical protein